MKKVHVTLKNFYGQAYQGNKLMQLWHFFPYGYPVYTICCPRVPGCNRQLVHEALRQECPLFSPHETDEHSMTRA